MLVLASALRRFHLYDQAFGMTEERLLAVTVLVWVTVTIAWLAVVVIRDTPTRFAFGSVVAGLVILAAWNVMNPAGFVATHNIDKSRVETSSARGSLASASYDAEYAVELSADAVPALVRGLDEMPAAKRTEVASALLRDWDEDTSDGWREWNFGRSRAREAVRAHRERLVRARE
jgi:two-component system, OmpR family, sensor histidine kinase BaeS